MVRSRVVVVALGVGLLVAACCAEPNPWVNPLFLDDFELEHYNKCPCVNKESCLPVAGPQNQKEVLAFSPQRDGQQWRYYDWNTVTAVAWNENKDLLCFAHERNRRFIILSNFDNVAKICDPDARREWIQNTYKRVVMNYADGVNLDTEKPLRGRDAKCLTKLVQELRLEFQFHEFTRNALITYDVAWAPHGVDGRFYDWKGLEQASDYLFVMSYDLRSQIYDHCLAGPNTPLTQVEHGLEEFLVGYDIDPRKVVLGVAWYSYKYECLETSIDDSICTIRQESFEGAPCSDAAGRQMDYRDVTQWIRHPPPGYDQVVQERWHELSQTPYVVVKGTKGVCQIWYDNPRGLKLKYDLVRKYNLLGVGMWHADSLDYSGKDKPVNETALMWQTLAQVNEPQQVTRVV